MLFLLWTFIDIVGRSDKMLAKFEKRAYAGSERVWVGKYRNLHNIAHWHMAVSYTHLTLPTILLV